MVLILPFPFLSEEEVGDEQTLKRNNSALNVAKLLKKTISKHNLFAASPEQAEAHGPTEHIQLNGHASSTHTNTNGHRQASPERDACSNTHPDPQADPLTQKHGRKKESCSLATVTEEIGVNGETEDRYCWTVQILATRLRFILFLSICNLFFVNYRDVTIYYFSASIWIKTLSASSYLNVMI